MKKKKLIELTIICTIIILSAAYILIRNSRPTLKYCPIIHDEKFGGVYAKISIEDFNKLGFEYGDSVDVYFTKGQTIEDIPYYNGYYVDVDNPLVVGYPGSDYIKIGVNYGVDIWEAFTLVPEDTITIKLHKAKKYLDIQESRDLHYSDEQGNQTDAEFANFRSVNATNIKPGILYRSASPNNNEHNRASVVDKLIKEAGIKYIVNLSDSVEDIEGHINKEDFNSPYFLSLYKNNRVTSLSMSMQFKSEDFSKKLVQGLTNMANNDGPYLVHCVEGKDRTGYVIMVLEALVGASYQEIVDDYMETYKNYYSITKEKDTTKYNIIKETNIDEMFLYMTNKTGPFSDDFIPETTNYLLSIGMDQKTIDKLKEKLSK